MNSEIVSYLFYSKRCADFSLLAVRRLALGGDVMSQKKTATGEFLDPREFGEMLNMNRESIYRACANGSLEFLRVGRAIRLPRAQLDVLLGNCDADNQDERNEW